MPENHAISGNQPSPQRRTRGPGDALIRRRSVLSLAGVVLGAAAIDLGAPVSAGAATGGAAQPPLTLEPVPGDTVEVVTANPTSRVRYPRQLAVRVRGSAVALPAGTRLDITYDPRVYVPLSEVVVLSGGRRLTGVRTTPPVTDQGTGVTTVSVTFTQEVPATEVGSGNLVIAVGTVVTRRYPRDLVRVPGAMTARIPAHRSLREVPRRRLSGDAAPESTALAWGVELLTGWNAVHWGAGGEYRYYYPVQVTVCSTGPGRVPRRPVFAIEVDARLVRDVKPNLLRVADRPRTEKVRCTGTHRNGDVLRTLWEVPVVPEAGGAVDVGFDVLTSTPSGALTSIKHPVVSLVSPAGDHLLRETGALCVTRLDSVWE